MSQLVEIHHRIANTEAGQAQMEYEKAVAMMDAYGGMYRSVRRGSEFQRTYIAVRCELQYNIPFMEYDEDEDDEG